MRDVAGKRDRVPGAKADRLVGNIHCDRAELDLYQLLRARRVRFAHVVVARDQRPVPQLDDIRWFRAGHQHSASAGLTAPQRGSVAIADYPDRLELWRLDQRWQSDAWPVLKEGRNSLWPHATIRSLQYLQKPHGARLVVDGSFEAKTKAAVIAFQHSHHLPASGVVRAGTWKALVVAVKRGNSGPAVRAVQDQINFRDNSGRHTLTVDGVFGRNTEAAVRAFQHAMSAQVAGFVVDGIVGKQTWQALVTEALSG